MSKGEQNTAGLWPFFVDAEIDLNKALAQLGRAVSDLAGLIAGLRPKQPDLAKVAEDVRLGVDAVQQMEKLHADCALAFLDAGTMSDATLWAPAIQKTRRYLYEWNIRPQLDMAVGQLRAWQTRPELAHILDLQDHVGLFAARLEQYQRRLGSAGPTPSDQRLVPLFHKAMEFAPLFDKAMEGQQGSVPAAEELKNSRQLASEAVAKMAQDALDHHDLQPLVDIATTAGLVYTDLIKV